MPHHPPEPHHDDASKKGHDWLKLLAIGTTLAAGAVILSPYVLPALGIGDAALATKAIRGMHGAGLGTGLAGVINTAINAMPGIGSTLAQGGFATAAATGITGIGGVLLGRYLERGNDGARRVRWGKIIATAALLTSALIALPTALTGISVGLTYLTAVISGVEAASMAVTLLAKSIGAVGAMNFFPAGLSGAAAMLPHFFTCGVSLLPAGLAFALPGDSEKPPAGTAPIVGPVIAEVEVDRPTAIGRPCAAKIKLKHADSGLPLTADELAVVHTEKLHLFVADSSLKDYKHIHPQPTGEPGVFACSFTPDTANRYSIWAEVTPLEDGKTYQLKCDLPAAAKRHIPPSVRSNTHAEQAGLAFHWEGPPLQKNAAAIIEIGVTDARGNPVADLEPVMGARAHLVGFSADGNSLVHTHPLDGDPSRLRFHVEPDKAGAMQFYLQIRRHGEDIYVPFGQQIQPAEQMTKKNSFVNAAPATGYSL